MPRTTPKTAFWRRPAFAFGVVYMLAAVPAAVFGAPPHASVWTGVLWTAATLLAVALAVLPQWLADAPPPRCGARIRGRRLAHTMPDFLRRAWTFDALLAGFTFESIEADGTVRGTIVAAGALLSTGSPMGAGSATATEVVEAKDAGEEKASSLLHEGAVALIVDLITSIGQIAAGFVAGLSIDINVTMHKCIVAGDKLIVESRIVKVHPGQVMSLQLELRQLGGDCDGELVASGTQTKSIRAPFRTRLTNSASLYCYPLGWWIHRRDFGKMMQHAPTNLEAASMEELLAVRPEFDDAVRDSGTPLRFRVEITPRLQNLYGIGHGAAMIAVLATAVREYLRINPPKWLPAGCPLLRDINVLYRYPVPGGKLVTIAVKPRAPRADLGMQSPVALDAEVVDGNGLMLASGRFTCTPPEPPAPPPKRDRGLLGTNRWLGPPGSLGFAARYPLGRIGQRDHGVGRSGQPGHGSDDSRSSSEEPEDDSEEDHDDADDSNVSDNVYKDEEDKQTRAEFQKNGPTQASHSHEDVDSEHVHPRLAPQQKPDRGLRTNRRFVPTGSLDFGARRPLGPIGQRDRGVGRFGQPDHGSRNSSRRSEEAEIGSTAVSSDVPARPPSGRLRREEDHDDADDGNISKKVYKDGEDKQTRMDSRENGPTQASHSQEEVGSDDMEPPTAQSPKPDRGLRTNRRFVQTGSPDFGARRPLGPIGQRDRGVGRFGRPDHGSRDSSSSSEEAEIRSAARSSDVPARPPSGRLRREGDHDDADDGNASKKVYKDEEDKQTRVDSRENGPSQTSNNDEYVDREHVELSKLQEGLAESCAVAKDNR